MPRSISWLVVGQNRHGHPGEAGQEGTSELGDDRERGRNGADAEPAGQALVDLVEFVAQIFDLGENPMGVVQDDLSLGRQADIPMAALDDRRPEIVFEQPDRSR